ncbi:MAG: pilus assembly protein TadG-related protein [Microvirga sp.]|nr:pilus assembly protein TadG-related protein [Microvirga sp.]
MNSFRKPPFARCARGNVGMIFGLILIPIAVAAGSALDYSSASQMRAKLQAASDAAAIAGDMATPWSVAACEAQARNYFVNNTTPGRLESDPNPVVTCGPGGTTVSVAARVRTSLLGVVGVTAIDIETFSRTTCLANGSASGSGEPLMWRQESGLPNMTRIVTLGEFQNGAPRYLITPDGRPIVRLDNPFDGPATITIRAAPSAPMGNISFDVPEGGQFIVVMPWAPAAQATFFVEEGPAPRTNGSATWSNVHRLETRIEDIPGTPIHEPTGERACWMSQ